MRAMWRAATRVVGMSLVGAILCGCSSAMMGIRPSEPPVRVTAVTAETRATAETKVCDEYIAYVEYARNLQEAYHSRATQNRWWIYGAGIIGLGAVAAGAGLAAASAATVGTMALLGIGGGFSAGVFATLDNSTLADIYTIAAIRVDTALKDAYEKLPVDARGNRYADYTKCNEALRSLRGAVSDARSRLERARTDSAMAAVERALHQQQVLRKLTEEAAAAAQEGDPSVIPVGKAEITAATLSADGSKITLKVYARLDLAPVGMKVEVDVDGSKELRLMEKVPRLLTSNTWEVVVNEAKCPAGVTPPVPLVSPCKDYKFALVLDAKKRIEGTTDLKLTRP
jgi:hypothetical protein